MKIRKVEAWPLEVPMNLPYRTALSERSTCPSVIVRVETDDGVEGWGQATVSAPLYAPFFEDVTTMLRTIRDLIAPALVGLDPRALGLVHRVLDRVSHGHRYAHAAVDLALHDAVARAQGVPVATLLGGAVRTVLPATAPHFGYLGPEETARTALAFVEQGYRYLNLRAGRDLDEDVATLSAVRRAVGDDIVIDLDFSQSLSLHQGRPDDAIRYLKRLEAFGVASFEQPLAAHDLEGMARLASALDTPIVADESVFTPEDAVRVIRAGAADVIKVKLVKTGGIYHAQRLAAVAAAHGIPLSVGHGLAGTVQNAAELHFACSLHYWKPPAEMVGFARLDGDAAEGIRLEGGRLLLGEAPGLGIRLRGEVLRAAGSS